MEWISLKNIFPENGIEVLCFNPKWINEDFNPKGNTYITMKNFIRTTLLAISLTGCSLPDVNQPAPTLNYVPEAKTFVMPEALKGNYKEHLGEVNKGTISITENTFVIESEMFTVTVTLNSENALAEGCYLYITLEDGIVIKITNWIESGNRIYIVLLDSELEYELGNFYKLKTKN